MSQSEATERAGLANCQVDCVLAAAQARGLPAEFLEQSDDVGSRWLRVVVAGRAFLFSRGAILDTALKGRSPLGRHINEDALFLMRHKARTKEFLSERGFSTPRGWTFHRRDLAAARQAFDRFDGPVCVKPEHGKGGADTFIGVSDRARYEAALACVAASSQRILVEESLDAQLIRFFYIRPSVVGIKYGRPASVVGDGVSTITQLVAERNQERRRRALPSHMSIPTDTHTQDHLRAQGLTLEHVPALSQRIFLRGTSNETTGSDGVICTDQVHPSYAALIERACQATPGLQITAVDTMISDITQPAAEGNHWILELNGSPGYASFLYPWEGQSIDVAGLILDYLATDYSPSVD